MPFAFEMPPPPVIVLCIVFGSMIVGFILDRIARAVGLRRFKGWDYLAAIVCAGVGGYFGMIDGDERSIAVGAAVGFIAGALIASVVFGALAAVYSFFSGPPVKEEDEGKPRKVSIFRRFAILIFGALPVAFAALVAHEVYWLANMGAFTLQYNVGFQMYDYTDREESMEKLAEDLTEQRWQIEAVSHRPAKWVVHTDYHDANAEVLYYLKMFAGDKPPKEQPASWDENDVVEHTMWTTWNQPDFAPKRIPDTAVNELGIRISKQRLKLFNDILDRTLALRYLPREVFVRGEKVVRPKGKQANE